MINLDDRLLDATQLKQEGLILLMHYAKLMKPWRMTAVPSLEELSKSTCWNEKTVRKWRTYLEKVGWIRITQRPGQTPITEFLKPGIGIYMPVEGKYEENSVLPLPKNGTPEKTPLPKNGPPPLPIIGTPPSQYLVPTIIKDIKSIKLSIRFAEIPEYQSLLAEKEGIGFVRSVVSDLNGLIGTGYSEKTKSTQSKILARKKEGYSLQDFQIVHKYKVKEWRGTEHEKYLRPETLYGSKFEGYLQAAKMDAKKNLNGHSKQSQDGAIMTSLEKGRLLTLTWIYLYSKELEIKYDAGNYELMNEYLESLPPEAGVCKMDYVPFIGKFRGLSIKDSSNEAKIYAIKVFLKEGKWRNQFFRNEILEQRKSKNETQKN